VFFDTSPLAIPSRYTSNLAPLHHPTTPPLSAFTAGGCVHDARQRDSQSIEQNWEASSMLLASLNTSEPTAHCIITNRSAFTLHHHQPLGFAQHIQANIAHCLDASTLPLLSLRSTACSAPASSAKQLHLLRSSLVPQCLTRHPPPPPFHSPTSSSLFRHHPPITTFQRSNPLLSSTAPSCQALLLLSSRAVSKLWKA
jgi:hypothetical protein